ncbi:uncharacterized protein LOC135836674 [Planococcus citri]|uniref:uncharacterized protein LOC135836674 n=1 Tax=Planococcus citri TaxID=170843 RepID=UPI0031F8A55C
MSPRTRLTSVKDNRSLRSKKLSIVGNVRISLTRCDTNKPSRSSKHEPSPSKKNIVKVDGKSSTLINSPTPKSAKKQDRQLSPTKKKPTRSVEKSPAKKPVAVENDVRKLNSKGSTPKKTVTKDKQSPKKPAPLRNVKQSPIKTMITQKETSDSEVQIKKPLLKKALTKESRLKQQMKLGRIFINPTFPSKTVFKRQTYSADKDENQGQLVTTDTAPELNNNVVKVKRVQPNLVLRKVDHQTEKPIRDKRKIFRHL